MHLLKKSSVGLTVGLVALATAASSPAAPTLTISTSTHPIPGFPGTGDMLGAGAMIVGHGTLTGSEYDGAPPPLIGIRLFVPAGVELHPQGFPTCTATVLEKVGPAGCPKGSAAGPKGSGLGVVSFGGERVPETASIQLYFAPGGTLLGFVDGTTPTVVEVIVPGRFVAAVPPFSLEYVGEVPLIESVPGAPDASFLEGTIPVGTARRQGNKTISYLTLPRTCAKGGWTVRAELSFLGGATAKTTYAMPCPRGKTRHG